MRIVVSSSGEALNQQIRSYAEYRMFSALSMHDDVLEADVQLCAAGDVVQCRVHVSLRSRVAIDTHASASSAATAIDRTAGRVADLIAARRSPLSR